MAAALKGAPNYKHPHYRNLTLFVQQQKKQNTNHYWTCRITFSKKRQHVRSLKLPYIPNDAANAAEADRRALEIYFQLTKRFEQGFSIARKNFDTVARTFLERITEQTKANELAIKSGAQPYNRTLGGKSFWNAKELELFNYVINEILLPYFTQEAFFSRGIETYTTRELRLWSEWRIETRQLELGKRWSPPTLNRQNRVLRTIFRYALNEALIDNIPEIQNFKAELAERSRPEMTQEQYDQLMSHLEERYRDETKPAEVRVYQRFFYLWCATLDATGIRPWNSAENALKWDDIEIIHKPNNEIQSITIKRKEKSHSYEAVADEHWVDIYNDLRVVHRAWGIDSPYVFAHPISKGKIVKGAPILSYKHQWKGATKKFGWAEKGAAQKDRISPYSIRHRYARRRLQVDPTDPHYIPTIKLAQAMGTSVEMLEKLYVERNSKQDWSELTRTGYSRADYERVRIYDELGNVMAYVERNSDEHWAGFLEHHDGPTEWPDDFDEQMWTLTDEASIRKDVARWAPTEALALRFEQQPHEGSIEYLQRVRGVSDGNGMTLDRVGFFEWLDEEYKKGSITEEEYKARNNTHPNSRTPLTTRLSTAANLV